MKGEDPMRDAGWGSTPSREGFSERDPALGRSRTRGATRRGRPGRPDSRMPLGALLIALIGLAAGVIGGALGTPGNSRLNLSIGGGIARAGFAVAILAGLWIAFGARDRAPGARLIGTGIAVLSVLLLIVFA